MEIPILTNIFKHKTQPAPNGYEIPYQENIEEVTAILDEIRDHYYIAKMSAARRLVIGTKVRKLHPDLYKELSSSHRMTLRLFHESCRIAGYINLLIKQREEDSRRGKPMFNNFETLKVLAANHHAEKALLAK